VARAANKTVRFTRVVERSGRPHIHTLWLPPDKDPEFKRAREAHRVMTLEQTPGGGKADFGIVGFDAKHDHGGQFLIFPKSIKPFEGARVVGVKFDLVEQPKLAPADVPKRKPPPREKSSARHARKIVSFEPKPAPEVKKIAKKIPPADSVDCAALIREVRAALKDLERSKYVIAYQRLKRALG
jgi:hypothetical protein